MLCERWRVAAWCVLVIAGCKMPDSPASRYHADTGQEDIADVSVKLDVDDATTDTPKPDDGSDEDVALPADADDITDASPPDDAVDASDVTDVLDGDDLSDVDDAPDVSDADASDSGVVPCDASLTTDPMHCGTCGHACGANQFCAMGACGCASGFGDCDGNAFNGCETDLTTPAHCGSCSTACPARANSTAACVGGACVPRCNAGFGDCDGVESNGCEANGLTDVSNCAGCGVVCQTRANATSVCTAGACAITCSPGYGNCDGDITNGCEMFGFTDPANCGGCGRACSVGQSCVSGACVSGTGCSTGLTSCSGMCVDLLRDLRNCGACGTACRTGQTCVAGSCRCPTGQTVCGSACTDTRTDARNCGMCGVPCASGGSCAGGTCNCPSGQIVCGGRCVNPQSDDSNCGRCGNVCAVSGACTLGNCVCGGRGEVCCLISRCAAGLMCSWGFCR